VISFSVFQTDIDNLADRQALIGTYFLAAFAMLYVVGETLPQPDFLTKIDLIITMNTLLLAAACLAVTHVATVAQTDGMGKAQRMNDAIQFILAGVYIGINLLIFPWGKGTYMRTWSRHTRVQSSRDNDLDHLGVGTEHLSRKGVYVYTYLCLSLIGH